MNQQNFPALADLEVRRAIALGLNRQEITHQAVFGGAVPYTAALPRFVLNTAPAETSAEFDPENARHILEAAGWIDTDGNGIREKEFQKKSTSTPSKVQKERVDLTFTLSTSDWPDLVHAATLIKDMLGNVGISITIDSKPLPELESSVLRPRNFSLLLFGQVYGNEPDPFAFWHSSQEKDPGLNITQYKNPAVDKLLEDARREPNSEARKVLYTQVEQSIEKDIPAVFLFSQLYLYVLPPDMKGVHIERMSLPADRFNEVQNWYLTTKRVFKGFH